MAFGFRPAGMFAWHRWKLGWLDPDQIACFTGRQRIRATVTPPERPGGPKAIVFRGSRSAYVAEVRQPIAEDAGICRKGVLIYRVDFRAPAGAADILLLRARPDGTARRCGRRARHRLTSSAGRSRACVHGDFASTSSLRYRTVPTEFAR
jgi:hypothetical protein